MALIYPGGDAQVTPNLGLATWGMDEVLAENMILIDAAAGGGTGTVTSVAMTGDGVIFNSTIGGSPITTAGTLIPSLLTQVANKVLAGPTSGLAATPTFRALVAADIPALPYGTGTVTSVAMTGDGTIFNATVSGSPISVSGTLAPSLLTQVANRILAGPTTGAAAAPTFRALVAADIPDISATYQLLSLKDAANGYAGLDANIKLKPAEMILTRNAQTGASYAVQDSDRGKIIEISNSTASTLVALIIAQAGAASSFVSGWYCTLINLGPNAALLTPTTSTIAGAAQMCIPAGASAIVYSDGTNYQALTDGAQVYAGQGGFGSWGLTGPITTASANIAIATANTVKVVRFFLSGGQLVSSAVFWIGTTAAAGKIAYSGIYDGRGNKLFQVSFSTTTASTKVSSTASVSTYLLPGVYYYALTCDASTPTTDTITPGNGGTGLLQNTTIVQNGNAANALSAGLLPATLGAITTAAISMGLTWFFGV